jgi:hypothetical protein
MGMGRKRWLTSLVFPIPTADTSGERVEETDDEDSTTKMNGQNEVVALAFRL